MDETVNNTPEKKKGVSKGLIAIIVAAVLVIGGSVAAFVLLDNSAKAQYFLAEKNSLDYIGDKFEDRYQPEMDWLETSEENPTESTVELSAEYNDPNGGMGYGMGLDPSQIINNSTITLTTAADMEEKQISTELAASFGGMEIDGVQFHVTAEKILLGLPFINEILQLKDEDLGPLLKEVDPETFTGEESMNLEQLFEGTNSEDLEYFKEEYGKMIFEELPEDAFEQTEESIKVQDQSLDTEKISLHLSEEQVKDIIVKTLEKMKDDEKLKEMIREQMALQQFGGTAMSPDADQFIADFEAGLEEGIDEIDKVSIPDGLNSTIWVTDDLIAQRDFSVKLGSTENEDTVTLAVKGTQLLEDAKQSFNYDFSYDDGYTEGTMNLTGDLSWKDNQATDSLALTIADTVLSYTGEETLDGTAREFERTFSFEDPMNGEGSLIWSGNANYEGDQMTSEHSFSVNTPDMSQDMFSLHAAVEGKTIDSVELPNEDNVKDIGSMSMDELSQYFNTEVTPQFQQWVSNLLYGGAGF
ncbi:flagellar basal body protein FliL [Oceanobacillus picturae]|uniref:Flagellar basal body protein FliL n=1 Tax=Oceanobacillus picturae TaxID=171693 RepID=A0A0U9H8E8_9BACI|nr:DUF6583 family protein [Oceanobacillus picturae]GAQ18942.1 flagellar basal body protein FliL [Oceanobacillus picturae]